MLTDACPTGYFGAQLGDIVEGDVVVVFGAGPADCSRPSRHAMAYMAEKPTLAESGDHLRARIPGWGVDLDPKDRPSVARERFDPALTGAHWDFPERQAEKWRRQFCARMAATVSARASASSTSAITPI